MSALLAGYALSVPHSERYGYRSLCADTRTQFEQQALDALDRGELLLVLDLRGVPYIDSAGLGSMVRITKRARAAGAELVLVEPNEDLVTLFDLTRLDTVLTIRSAAAWITGGVER